MTLAHECSESLNTDSVQNWTNTQLQTRGTLQSLEPSRAFLHTYVSLETIQYTTLGIPCVTCSWLLHMLVSNELGGDIFKKNHLRRIKILIHPFSLYDQVCDYGRTHVHTDTSDLNSESHSLQSNKTLYFSGFSPSPLLCSTQSAQVGTSAPLTQHFPVIRYLRYFRFLALIK